MDKELRETAVQMFKDLYCLKVKGKYGECYYMKIPNGEGAYFNIKDTEKMLIDIPLKELSPDIIIQKLKRLNWINKQSIEDDNNEEDKYYKNRCNNYF